MKYSVSYRLLLLLFSFNTFSQINTQNIEIVRDNFGVPHIYAKTDAELAYGLAWAHSEDDFKTIQEAYLAGNALLSKHLGKRGAPADFLAQLIQSRETVDSLFHTLNPAFVKVLEGYALGINSYAKEHPEEVLLQQLFPITPKKMVIYSFLQLFISNAADKLVGNIVNNNTPEAYGYNEAPLGSNTFAFNSSKTGENTTFLAINTHQPLDGPTSWYEVHLVSEEGTNILGATFAGAPCILTGANEYLGWSHTVNYPDKADVYQLQMHPTTKNAYLVDGEIHHLKKYRATIFVKFLGINIPIRKKFYKSIYGPTLKNKRGYFSVRTPSLYDIRALEQWWRMNKATSFHEFYKALKMKALPGYNIGYADRNDTIFYISNGRLPIRNEHYDWTKTLPGNTTQTLWNSYHDIEALPQVINPKSGFVYNANHSPFKSTAADENPLPSNFSKTLNFELYDNNRSTRLLELINEHDVIDYETFKKIKYDHTLPSPLHYNFMDINALFEMKPEDFPDISGLLRQIQTWDRRASADSFGAGAYAIFYYQLGDFYDKIDADKKFTPSVLEAAMLQTKAYMIKHFGSENVRLGDYQRLVRGQKKLPIFGLPDVITAMRGIPDVDGRLKITHGESYIGLVQFSKEKGTQIESIISYGSSDHPSSPHYNDQMDLYAQFKTKKMSLNRADVYQKAQRIYHPK